MLLADFLRMAMDMRRVRCLQPAAAHGSHPYIILYVSFHSGEPMASASDNLNCATTGSVSVRLSALHARHAVPHGSASHAAHAIMAGRLCPIMAIRLRRTESRGARACTQHAARRPRMRAANFAAKSPNGNCKPRPRQQAS